MLTQYIASRLHIATLFVSATTLAVACSKNDTNPDVATQTEEPSPPHCEQGDTRECVGPGACKGGQICDERGLWKPCQCGGAMWSAVREAGTSDTTAASAVDGGLSSPTAHLPSSNGEVTDAGAASTELDPTPSAEDTGDDAPDANSGGSDGPNDTSTTDVPDPTANDSGTAISEVFEDPTLENGPIDHPTLDVRLSAHVEEHDPIELNRLDWGQSVAYQRDARSFCVRGSALPGGFYSLQGPPGLTLSFKTLVPNLDGSESWDATADGVSAITFEIDGAPNTGIYVVPWSLYQFREDYIAYATYVVGPEFNGPQSLALESTVLQPPETVCSPVHDGSTVETQRDCVALDPTHLAGISFVVHATPSEESAELLPFDFCVSNLAFVLARSVLR